MTETLQHHEQADNVIYPEEIEGNEGALSTELQRYFISGEFINENSPTIGAAAMIAMVEGLEYPNEELA